MIKSYEVKQWAVNELVSITNNALGLIRFGYRVEDLRDETKGFKQNVIDVAMLLGTLLSVEELQKLKVISEFNPVTHRYMVDFSIYNHLVFNYKRRLENLLMQFKHIDEDDEFKRELHNFLTLVIELVYSIAKDTYTENYLDMMLRSCNYISKNSKKRIEFLEYTLLNKIRMDSK